MSTQSSCEAEIIALQYATCETEWIRDMIETMGMKQDGPTTIYEDNKSAMILINRGFSKCNRYLAKRYIYIHETQKNKLIKLIHLSTKQHMADILTKGITGTNYKKYKDQIMKGKILKINSANKITMKKRTVSYKH